MNQWPQPLPNLWLFTIPDHAPIHGVRRAPAGFRENGVRTSVGTTEYLSPAFSEWWEFDVLRVEVSGLEWPCLSLVTKPKEQFTHDMTGHQAVAIVGERAFGPAHPERLILRVVDGRTWHATGRTTDWPPLPIPIPEDWPIFGVRGRGEKKPEVRQTAAELEAMLRGELGDLEPRKIDGEGKLR